MIQLKAKSGGIDLAQKLAKGDDGGYYIPIVDENGNLNWLPSEEEMPLVDASNIRGPRGDSGIYIGSEPPEDEDIAVWVNPKGEMSTELATKEYVDEKIAEIDGSDIDLTGYATEQYVNDAISTIELTPGPAGPQGEPGIQGERGKDGIDGKDGQDGAPGADGKNGEDGYTPIKGTDYWTDEDKAAIVSDVLDALPSAEGVEV